MKLLGKREIRESLQPKLTNKSLQTDACATTEFEYTPTQRFISQFMSPNTPYNGMLLYHGVGVGKTCTAVLTAEAFLELSPKNKVYILAPPAIQDGFYRTLFDINRVKLGVEPDDLNEHEGCTGNRYLQLTQTQYEREKKDIEFRVTKLIKKRYSIMGYVAFRNMVRDILDQIPKNLKPERKLIQETRLLQKALSGCLIIVDEAHNLRTVSDTTDEGDDADDDADGKNDAAAGLFNHGWAVNGVVYSQFTALIDRQGLHMTVDIDISSACGCKRSGFRCDRMFHQAPPSAIDIGLNTQVNQHDRLIRFNEVPVAFVFLFKSGPNVIFQILIDAR
jgi:hypothetical protein